MALSFVLAGLAAVYCMLDTTNEMIQHSSHAHLPLLACALKILQRLTDRGRCLQLC
jgi:hypothetical protein